MPWILDEDDANVMEVEMVVTELRGRLDEEKRASLTGTWKRAVDLSIESVCDCDCDCDCFQLWLSSCCSSVRIFKGLVPIDPRKKHSRRVCALWTRHLQKSEELPRLAHLCLQLFSHETRFQSHSHKHTDTHTQTSQTCISPELR